MLEKLKKLLLYAGAEPEDFARCQMDVQIANRRRLTAFLGTACAFFVALTLGSCMVPLLYDYIPVFAVALIVGLGLLAVEQMLPQKLGLFLNWEIYAFGAMLYVLGIYLGTVQSPDQRATAFFAFLLYVPMLFMMRPILHIANVLLFDGVVVHAVHAPELAKPQTQFPRAMFLAALISFGLFTLGALAVAIITPYDQINLQSGLFTTFQIAFERYHVGWLSNVMGLLVAFGALAGVMSWISGPSRGLLWTARDGALPCFLQKTNKNGVQLNILIIQGCIVTLLSSLYIVMDDVSVAFFLLSALTVGLYLIMYMMMYAAGIRLRYTQPKLIRSYRVPGGNTGMWLIGGVGFLAVLFSFIVTFFPPSQLPVGSPATYTWLVVTGTAVFLAIPFIISFSMDKRNARRTPEA